MNHLDDVIGDSLAVRAIRRRVERLLSRLGPDRRLPPVLIVGETGTGKGLLARAMHRASRRADGPFIALSCAAIPETLLEAELFGFERGAFTDARHAKLGLFHAAHRGTLFLDELGALPLPLQTKLLTAVEERVIRRLGSTRSEPVNVWVIAATSEDLVTAMRAGAFRRDLYHRLTTIGIALPPLRDRGGDIVALADHFLERACRDYGVARKHLAPAARAALMAYSWPGNVRELANLMERTALLVDATQIAPEHLEIPAIGDVGLLRAPAAAVVPLRESVGDFERSQLVTALRSAEGNVSRAAARLGIPRSTLRYRLEHYRLRARADGEGRPADVAGAGAGAPGQTASAGAAVPDAAAPWIRRRVMLLWTVLGGGLVDGATADAGYPLALAMEKVRAFGGRIERLSGRGFLASFPATATEDTARRAFNAAVAIQAATRRAREATVPVAVRALVHAAECRTEETAQGAILHPEDCAEAITALTRLARQVAEGSIVVSPEAAEVLDARAGEAATGVARAPRGADAVPTRLAGRPRGGSIAVLPFVNLSGDADQEHFSDGITEDVVAALSRLRWLIVIAGASTLVYKSRPADVRQIGAELGVRYLVTGTVRRSGQRLRVTADLVLARRRATIWTDRHEGVVSDLFDSRDSITSRIVATLDTRLRLAETSRALRKRVEDLDAYDCVLRALHALYRLSFDDFQLAGDLLVRAASLDPSFAAAYTWRAWWYLWKIAQGWSSAPDADARETGRLVEAALGRDPDDPFALAVSGHCAALLHHDWDTALSRFERSLLLNPNSAFTWGLSAATQCYLADHQGALDRVTIALRLSPFDPFRFYFFAVAALAEMLAGRHEAAVSWASMSRGENPHFSGNLRLLAACLAHVGRLDEARRVARDFMEIERSFAISTFRQRYPLVDAVALEAYETDLRKAGLPE